MNHDTFVLNHFCLQTTQTPTVLLVLHRRHFMPPVLFKNTQCRHFGFHIALCGVPCHCCTCRQHLLYWHINKNSSPGHTPTCDPQSYWLLCWLSPNQPPGWQQNEQEKLHHTWMWSKRNLSLYFGVFLLAFPHSYRQGTFGKGIKSFPASFTWKRATD